MAEAYGREVRFEPDERAPPALAFGLGVQYVLLTIAGIVLGPAIIVRAAGESESYLAWAVFGALVVSGSTTILQAARLGRIGSGHILLMGTSGAFIAVCVGALQAGGPALMATLIVVSSLCQFLLSSRLSLLRRVLTPVVAGTVIMLISVTVMPILFDMLAGVAEDVPRAGAPTSAAATLLVTVALALKAKGALRLWAPVIGIVCGCAASAGFGMYDVGRVASAEWLGLPAIDWPGLDLNFGPAFWALLPVFILVTVVGAIETIGDAIAIQNVSRRQPGATDFRVVQGAVAADGAGNLLSGLVGTVPNTTYSTSAAITELTGVAARNVGVWIGIILVVLAFLPKSTAVILAVPDPVVAGFGLVLLSMLFVLGMRIVFQDGIDYRRGVVVGVAFWTGVGFQNQLVFADYLPASVETLVGNGMTMGGLAAILMTLLLEVSATRPRRLRTRLGEARMAEVRRFVDEWARSRKWQAVARRRLRAATDEAMLSLMHHRDDAFGGEGDVRPKGAAGNEAERHLLVVARGGGGAIELEFVASGTGENLEDQLAFGGVWSEESPDREISLSLLGHYASSVRHQQYHDTDVVTLRVDAEG